MLRVPRGAAALAVACMAAGAAQAAVLTFEEAAVSGSLSPTLTVPAGYGGLHWSAPGAEVYSVDGPLYFADDVPLSGFAVAPVTGPKVAWSDRATARIGLAPGAISFDFAGAFWTQGWSSLDFGFGAQFLSFEGRFGGATLFTSGAHEIRTTGPLAGQYIALGWTGLDELLVHNSLPDWAWAMDDFTYALNLPPPAPVPAPPALLLLGSGLLLLMRRGR